MKLPRLKRISLAGIVGGGHSEREEAPDNVHNQSRMDASDDEESKGEPFWNTQLFRLVSCNFFLMPSMHFLGFYYSICFIRFIRWEG